MDETTKLPNLPSLDWDQKTIRDPIWGEIPITQVEKSIIQTESFYRLRGIKQLSFAYLAFPGAVHSRFEHSIGVMHATDMLLKMVRSEKGDQGIKISPFHRQLLRLAALLHDIGHPPFSHVMENLFTFHPDILGDYQSDLPKDFSSYLNQHGKKIGDVYKHEFFSEYIIRQHNDITQVLKNWIEKTSGYPKAYIKKYSDIINEVISQLAIGKSLNIDPDEVPENLLPIMQLFKSIMSGDIDADKIDYLLRDNYYCGLPNRLDITSLRNHLILRSGGLEIELDARSFVHSLILARYTLITQVHQEMWGVFTTAKVIELLHKMLLGEPNPARKILDIFTKWDDSRLLVYLIDSGDSIIKAILTTQYPLKEIARLDNIETHPHVRECIQVLSESMHHYQIPKLQEDLRIASGNNDLFVHLHNVKSPEFSMKLSNGGDLLRDQILRGISEESLSNLSLAIYGDGNVEIDFQKLKTIRSDLLPCEDCPKFDECVGNLAEEGLKRLLAELAVRRYRKIAEDCGAKAILGADYLLLIMEKINSLCEKSEFAYPIRQAIYKIAKLLARNLQDKIEIKGKMILKNAEITSTFDQEVRKYEQMGLIAYSREIRKLPSESGPSRNVFRFDRRFRLSEYGRERLDKVRRFKGTVPEYEEYHKAWEIVEMEIQKHEDEIIAILKASR
ncbi:MAG: HD domain-containing protein [Anaerolineales bacterium]